MKKTKKAVKKTVKKTPKAPKKKVAKRKSKPEPPTVPVEESEPQTEMDAHGGEKEALEKLAALRQAQRESGRLTE